MAQGRWPQGVGWGFGEPGGDLLFRRLSGSTIGAEGFHGRVRDGIGCLAPRCGHQAGQTSMRPRASRGAVWLNRAPSGSLVWIFSLDLQSWPSVHGIDPWLDPGARGRDL
jgi:hypothetical protein